MNNASSRGPLCRVGLVWLAWWVTALAGLRGRGRRNYTTTYGHVDGRSVSLVGCSRRPTRFSHRQRFQFHGSRGVDADWPRGVERCPSAPPPRMRRPFQMTSKQTEQPPSRRPSARWLRVFRCPWRPRLGTHGRCPCIPSRTGQLPSMPMDSMSSAEASERSCEAPMPSSGTRPTSALATKFEQSHGVPMVSWPPGLAACWPGATTVQRGPCPLQWARRSAPPTC